MSHEPIQVLYVEDDPLDVIVLKEALQNPSNFEHEYNITHAKDLFTGLELLQDQPFDAVLLDMNLPEGVGEKNIIIFKKHAPLTPIICLTGSDSDELAINAVLAGAQDYVVKAFGNAHILNRTILASICRQGIENQTKNIDIPEDGDFLPVHYQTFTQITDQIAKAES